MFGKKIHLFTLFGFSVGIDFTWFLLAILVAWSLAAYLFPVYYRGYSTGIYWAMGVAGAVGLFFSMIRTKAKMNLDSVVPVGREGAGVALTTSPVS